jgi:hypothetical protein
MTPYELKHLPDAVYLDTNILEAAGIYLDKPWMSKLISFTAEYGIDLCITELVLTEWCKHIGDELRKQKGYLLYAAGILGEYQVNLPSIDESHCRLPNSTDLLEITRKRLSNAGFKIIENWMGPLEEMINDAVHKRPPFQKGGKGFIDAVILESYAADALQRYKILESC